jgi:tetratricopeptide (TPR) repeat protein
LEISGEVGSGLDSPARAQRLAILLAWSRLEEAAAEADLIDSGSEPYLEVADLRAAQGRYDEAEEIWHRALDTLTASEDRLDRAEAVVGYARFLACRGRSDEATGRLAQARDLVQDTGAKFHERLIREAEALIT